MSYPETERYPHEKARSPGPFSAAEFATRQIHPRPWLVPDLIPGCQVSTIDGDGGLGKSTLGLQLGLCAVTGRSWLDQPVARGPVLYLSAEDDEDELHRRLHAMTVHAVVGFEDLADFHVWPLAVDDPALVAPGKEDSIVPTARWGELIAAIDRIKPILVVLDSRADVFGGNEVSRGQARAFVGMLRKLAVGRRMAVVMLSHPSLSGMSSGNGSSGSTHWRNAIRAALYLTRPDDGEGADLDARKLEVKKSNYGPGGLSLRLRWSGGVFVVDGEEGRSAPVDKATAQAGVERIFLDLMTAYEVEGRAISNVPSSTFAPALFAQDPRAKGATKAGLTAAMARLFAQGKITVETVGPASRQRRRLVRKVAS